MAAQHLDVLIVGAGISGIDAGYHLQRDCPDKRYAILEARAAVGGTWDLFRYPGIRSDSDMYTLGYGWKPWNDPRAIVDGASILDYVRETAREHGIDQKILFEHRVTGASWSSQDARWTVTVERGAAREPINFTCNFVMMCSGYYDYDAGYTPELPGIESFGGRVVHPQNWTSDIDYAGKRVIVIGSGATAVTLVPALAKQAAHVTMLQRSPTYVIALPGEDELANRARALLPDRLAYKVTRLRHVFLGMFFYRMCKRYPELMKRMIRNGVRQGLGPSYDIDTHFKPRYQPWDQRVCIVPDGDLFTTLREGRAEVVTDHIESFTERGIRLRSGKELAADLVVTATGLNLKLLGGLQVVVDGKAVSFSEALSYKGMMYSDVPNFAACIGYTNASWTLKCDLTCAYVCRLLNEMASKHVDICTPRQRDPSVTAEPWIDFSSSYVQRSLAIFPKQGSKAPWRLYQNYWLDLFALKLGKLDDGVLEFSSAAPARSAASLPGS